MLLELGVAPQVAAACSQGAILLSSSAAAVFYITAKAVTTDYVIAFAIIGFSATLFGQVWREREGNANTCS
jgi:uncharacterized membrane protein YfcA